MERCSFLTSLQRYVIFLPFLKTCLRSGNCGNQIKWGENFQVKHEGNEWISQILNRWDSISSITNWQNVSKRKTALPYNWASLETTGQAKSLRIYFLPHTSHSPQIFCRAKNWSLTEMLKELRARAGHRMVSVAPERGNTVAGQPVFPWGLFSQGFGRTRP